MTKQACKIFLLYTTMASVEVASDIAERAVELGYAGCVNIMPAITSVYRWQGAVQKEQECGMLFKAVPEDGEKLVQWLKSVHQYEVPAILHAVCDSSEEFFAFIAKPL